MSDIKSPTRPDRDTTPDDTVDIEDPIIVKAAERLNMHPAVVCVKWAVQHGQIPIPFSIHRNQYLLAAGTVGGGSLGWFRDQFGQTETAVAPLINQNPFELFSLQAAQSKPGANGLIFLPYIKNSSRSTGTSHAS